MYMTCKRCENKHFLIYVTHHDGDKDTYEFICAGCGDCVDKPDMDDYQTYLVKEFEKVRNLDESICLEEWVEEGAVVYYVSVYKGEELVGYKDFNTIDEATKCYKKSANSFNSTGSIDTVISVFDEF